jgi:hypothetical protein
MAKQQREIKVLVRYQIKQDCPEKGLHKGDVVLYVENDKGVRYYTTLRKNHIHTCTCKARPGSCYHVARGREMENARIETRKAARKVVAMPAQKVASPVGTPEKQEVPTDLSNKGTLNVSRPFSILKIA